MLFNHILLSAFLLVSDSAAKAITLRSDALLDRRNDLDEIFRRTTSEVLDSTLVSREAQPTQSSGSVTAPVTSTGTITNTTTACIKAVSAIGNATNPAGIVACYALPYWNVTNGMFTAELHLYSMGSPTGAFTNIPQKDVLFTMAYSAATISSLTKRAKRSSDIEQRQNSNVNQLQVSTFVGSLDNSLHLDKLNTTELMSLLIPTITLEARSPSTQKLVASNMTAADIAYFPAGAFSTQSQSAIAAAEAPALAAEAKTKAAGFVLPGTTLGIFPTGLIVTGSWAVLFLGAFGLGTLGRIRHRQMFRSRIANPRSMR